MNTSLKRVLEAILVEEDIAQRTKALHEHAKAAPDKVVSVLIELLDSPERMIRHRASAALSNFKAPALVEQYVEVFADKLCHHEDEWVRLGCAIYLMSAQSPVAESAYLHALHDPFVKVVQIACVQAASYREPGQKALLDTLNHSSWRVRLEVCKALIIQRTADQSVVETLEKMKSDPEAAVYDAECDELDGLCGELDELVKKELVQGSDEPHQWWDGRWGKLDRIITQAREVAAGNRSVLPSSGP